MAGGRGRRGHQGGPLPRAATTPGGRSEQPPWRLRFSPRILEEDLKDLGADAYETARTAVLKKLKVAPDQYGAPLHVPLHGMRKLKVSHVRIVYQVDAARREVRIYMFAARRDIWDKDQPEIVQRARDLVQQIAAETQRGS